MIRRGWPRVRVPRVTGLDYRDAKRQLERRGLRWRVDDGPVEFDTGPPGPQHAAFIPVRRQSIQPGRIVRRGTVVRLTTR